MDQIRYAIITPAHNEAAFLPRVIESIASQHLRPVKWIILDDRSTDETWQVIGKAREAYPFIFPVKLEGDMRRELGGHVVHVFNEGLRHLQSEADYLVKMDADIVLPPDYFSILFSLFHNDEKLGMASGKLFIEHQGDWIEERFPDLHVTGACKTYRMTCFRQMGGLIPVYSWDILDGAKARMLGWRTQSFRNIMIRHLRMTGSARGMIRGNIGHGRGMYAVRSHPLFVAGRAVYRAFEPPYFCGLFIILGYLLGWVRREPRLADMALARFLRKEQLRRLLGRQLHQEVIRGRRFEKGQ